MTIILSLDASTSSVGWCLSTDDKYTLSGQFSPTGTSANERTKEIMYWLIGAIQVECVSVVVYERASGAHNNMNTNRVLGAVAFATWYVCDLFDVEMIELSPKEVKATGIYKGAFDGVGKYKIFQSPRKSDGSTNQAALDRINDEIDAIGLMKAYLQKEGRDLYVE